MDTRILVVDDDPKIASLLRRGLIFEGFAVEVAANGHQALEAARERPPDLVILDIMMPGLDGMEVCRRLRAADEGLPILLLTARDAVADQVLGLETGADDYVIKPFSFDILLARVRALLRRQEPKEREVLHFADLTLDTGTRQARRGDREVDFTTTEYELLLQFMRHPRQVLLREVLMDRVWGYDFEGNYNILEVYVRYLRSKLEGEGEPRLIQTVRGVGYVLRET